MGRSEIRIILQEARAQREERREEKKNKNKDRKEKWKKSERAAANPKKKKENTNNENPKKICWKCHRSDEEVNLSKCGGCKKVTHTSQNSLHPLMFPLRPVTAATPASSLTGTGMETIVRRKWTGRGN